MTNLFELSLQFLELFKQLCSPLEGCINFHHQSVHVARVLLLIVQRFMSRPVTTNICDAASYVSNMFAYVFHQSDRLGVAVNKHLQK